MSIAAPTKERIEGKSRSPPPRQVRGSVEGGSSASAATTIGSRTAVEAALAKPARQRSDEETLLAASVAKAGKWADVTDEIVDDSQ